MSDRTTPRSRRPGLGALALGAFLLLLAVATLVAPDGGGALQLANPQEDRVAEVQRLFDDALPNGGLVLVGMDPDLGTYPEIRPAVRAALEDLLQRGARLAFVSYSPEGRAIGAAEMERLREEHGADVVLDLGFVAGSEAGMVRTVTDLVPSSATGPVATAARAAGGGMTAFSLAVVVSGTELGARSWVEQVGTRVPALPLLAIAPTFAQPELAPYLRTGQLAGLLATVRDDAQFVATVRAEVPGSTAADLEAPPPAAPVLLGMLLALGAIGVILVRPMVGGTGVRR